MKAISPLLLVGVMLMGCSGNDRAPPPSASGRVVDGASTSSAEPAGMAGSAGAAGAPADGEASATTPTNVATEVPETIPETGTPIDEIGASGCESAETTGILIMDSGASNPAFDALGALGARRYAFARESLALITFDGDGTNSSSFIYGVVDVAAHSDSLHVLFDDISTLYSQEYDAKLVPIREAVELASGQARAASLTPGSNGSVLALHAGRDGLEGQLLQGTRILPFQVREPLAATARCQTRAASVDDGFHLSWTCLAGEMRVGWAAVNERGEVGQTQVPFTSDSTLELKSHVHTSSGELLLLNEGSSDALVVANLTSNGMLVAPLRRYLGVVGFGLAVREDGIGLIAATVDGRTVFRVLNADGNPRTDWRCLDEPTPGGYGALMADGEGYSALVRHANGSAWLVTLDQDGKLSR